MTEPVCRGSSTPHSSCPNSLTPSLGISPELCQEKQLLCPWWPVVAILFCYDPVYFLSVFYIVSSVDGAFLFSKPPCLSTVFLQSFPFRWDLLGSGLAPRKKTVSSHVEFMFWKHMFL